MSALSEMLIQNKALMIAAAAIAFFVAAVLILFIFRLAFGRRLHMPGGRARQMRLGIVDAFDLDRQRQLVIVRRDNIEHLILIGGPNDVLIESQIVRTEARGRDKEAREREVTYSPISPVKPHAGEPKAVPPLTAEPQPGAPEPAAPVAALVPPQPAAGAMSPPPSRGPAPAPLRRAPSPAPSAPAAPAPASAQMAAAKPQPSPPSPPHEPVLGEPEHGQGPTPAKPASPQPGMAPSYTRWPSRGPAAQTQAPLPQNRPGKPPAQQPRPAEAEKPVAGPPTPTLEGLESLEEEMAKLLGRGPNKP